MPFCIQLSETRRQMSDMLQLVVKMGHSQWATLGVISTLESCQPRGFEDAILHSSYQKRAAKCPTCFIQLVVKMGNSQWATLRVISTLESCQPRGFEDAIFHS